jgi:hypothetical protein
MTDVMMDALLAGYRVIVVIPQHPSGDYLNMESPRIILNYEFLSICR